MEILTKVLIGIAGVVIIALIMVLPIMWLWNDLVPNLFRLPEIGFKQALELSLLSSLLFKSSNNNK